MDTNTNTAKKIFNKKVIPVLCAVLAVFLTGSIVHTVSEGAAVSYADAAEVSAELPETGGAPGDGFPSEGPAGSDSAETGEDSPAFVCDTDPGREPLLLTQADLDRFLEKYAEAAAQAEEPDSAEEVSGESAEGTPEEPGNPDESENDVLLVIDPERVMIRRADSAALSLLILPDGQEEGSALTACSFNPVSETMYELSDVLTDQATPAAVAAALSENLTALYGEGAFTSPNLTALIARAIHRGELPWTVDYDGITFWFSDTLPFEVSEAAGSIPNARLTYAGHPELVRQPFRTVPARFMAGLTEEERFLLYDNRGGMHYIGLKIWDGSENGLSRLATVETDATKAVADLAYHTFSPYIVFNEGNYYLYADAKGDPGLRALFVYDPSAESLTDAGAVRAGIGKKHVLPTDPGYFEVENENHLLGDYRVYKFCGTGENGIPDMESPAFRIDMENQVFILKEDLKVMEIKRTGKRQDRRFMTLHKGVTLIPDTTNCENLVSFRRPGIDREYQVLVDTSAYPQNVDGRPWQKVFEIRNISEEQPAG